MRLVFSAPPADRGELAPLLGSRPRQPYWFYRERFDPDAFREFSLAQAEKLLRSAGTLALAARAGSRIEGLAASSRLAWDSEQFGFPAARLELLLAGGGYERSREVKTALLDALLEAQAGGGIRHVTARVDAGDFSTIHALEARGFELIDGLQTYSLPLDGAPPAAPTNGFQVRLHVPEDVARIAAIARSSYLYDRFHADSALTAERADRINEIWLRNACRGEGADAVVVAADGGDVLGYVTCRLEREAAALGVLFGTIVMVATAEEARGRGVALAATLGALDWFRSQGVDLVEVGTQIRNIPASRLYERCGFRLVATTLTLRKFPL